MLLQHGYGEGKGLSHYHLPISLVVKRWRNDKLFLIANRSQDIQLWIHLVVMILCRFIDRIRYIWRDWKLVNRGRAGKPFIIRRNIWRWVGDMGAATRRSCSIRRVGGARRKTFIRRNNNTERQTCGQHIILLNRVFFTAVCQTIHAVSKKRDNVAASEEVSYQLLLYRYWWNTRIFPLTKKSYLLRVQWRYHMYMYFYLSHLKILMSSWLQRWLTNFKFQKFYLEISSVSIK